MVFLSDEVGITALLQAMTCQGERHCEQGESVARTEVPVHEARQFEHHRAEYRDCGGTEGARMCPHRRPS